MSEGGGGGGGAIPVWTTWKVEPPVEEKDKTPCDDAVTPLNIMLPFLYMSYVPGDISSKRCFPVRIEE